MADISHDASEIKDTDIIFDCQHCGKSLAIDYRGAGLYIPCTDCGKNVAVPIPEGMELSDIDSSDEEQEIRILHLRKSLAAAEFRIEQLERELADLGDRRDVLETDRSQHATRWDTVARKVAVIEKAMLDISKALADITKITDAST